LEVLGYSQEYQLAVSEILKRNRIKINEVSTEGKKIKVVKEVSIDNLFDLQPPQEIISFKTRLLAGSATGIAGVGIGGYIGAKMGKAIATKIVEKIVKKGTLKLAAKAITKILGKIATKTTIGAAIGGAIGSVVPGAGTAVGAVAGAAIGAAIGIATDKLLLELEEAMNREKFKNEIISAIEEVRNEYKGIIKGEN